MKTTEQQANETVMNDLAYGLSDMSSHTKAEMKEILSHREWTAEDEVKYALGSHSVEWDGIYGTFWQTYDTEADMNEALDEYSRDIEEKVQAEIKRLVTLKAEKRKAFLASRNTMGNLFPELAQLC